MTKLSSEDQRTLDVLQEAVNEALERKRRLGQYAVVWQDGKPARIGGEEKQTDSPAPTAPSTAQKSGDA